MKQLTKRLLWQVFVLGALLSHLTQAEKKTSSQKKRRCPAANPGQRGGNNACDDCILVRLKRKGGGGNALSIRDLENRSIVPWTYDNKSSSRVIPQRVFNITCSKHCVGFEGDLNAVPIQREILVLRKEKGIVYNMDFVMVTVGCTCVHPEIHEKNAWPAISAIPT